MISVVIPLYNKEIYIQKTIENVLNQSFQNFEIVIINDGSTDKGPDIVKKIQDSRIKIINKENGGVSSARNIGIQNAKYDYIAFLDADDEWLPNHLEEINKLIIKYGDIADVFVTNFARKYVDNKIIPNRNLGDLKEGIIEDYFKIAYKKAIVHTSCVCITKSALLSIGGFDIKLSRGEDINLWIRLGKKYKIAYCPSVTENYLQQADNNSSKRFDIEKSLVYYLDFNNIIHPYEKKLYKKMLLKKYGTLLVKERDLYNFFKLFLKQGIKL